MTHQRTSTGRRLAALAVVLPLVACGTADDSSGDGGESTETATTTSSATETATTTVSPSSTGSPEPTDESSLPEDEPTTATPFPADLRRDTATASDGARLSPVGMRFGVHDGFDRVVIDLEGQGSPGWSAAYSDNPTEAGSGRPVELAGDEAIELTVTGVVLPTEPGAQPWSGATELSPQTAGNIEEVERGTLAEGRQQVFVGLQARRPFRVFGLDSPTRVVLDVYHPDVSTDGPLPGSPGGDEAPFPANREPDTRQASDGAALSPTDLRFGYHEGFDRLVLDLGGEGTPGWRAEYVDDPRLPGSGASFQLAGDSVLRVRVDGVTYPGDGGEEYEGPQRFSPDPAGVIEEVVYGSVFEGRVEVYVGVSSEQAFRVFLLDGDGGSSRVVVDVVHP